MHTLYIEQTAIMVQTKNYAFGVTTMIEVEKRVTSDNNATVVI
jgi:hypothetical protein